MAENKKYNSILVSGRKDETLTYSKYIKDEESGKSVKESLDKKVNITDELTTQQIKDGAITNEKMAADSVGNTNLQDGSVSNEKLEDGSITNEKLAENSITKDKLKDNTISVEKLDQELRQTINAATGLPENLVKTIQNVDDTLKDHQRQLDDKQSQIDDKQQQITANDEDISLLQTRSTQMEETIKGIAATGGASQATAVTYNNDASKLNAVNAQAAIDELQSSKIDKTSIMQKSGDAEDKVMSQKAVSDKLTAFSTGLSDLRKVINEPITEKKIANASITERKIAEGNVTETRIANGAVTLVKIAKAAIDALKQYSNTKTNLGAANFQEAIDKILTSYYAGGIVNINARYGINYEATYSLESAFNLIPSFEKTMIKGMLYFKNSTSRPTLAFYMGYDKSGMKDINNWVEIDIKNMLSISHFTYSKKMGMPPEDLTLSELIEKIPLSERAPGKVVFFKNKQLTYSLAIFNSDAYKSGWTNENNWIVVDSLDLKLVSSIKQIIDDISALKSNVNDKTNEINQLKEGLTGKVDKISGKVLSTNDYTNKDKEKLDALSIPTIPNSVIKNAVDTYVEENNADLSLKDKTLNVIKNYTYKLNEDVLGAPISIGTNWSGDMESGFTHTAGSEEALVFDISAIPLNSKILIRFDATNLKENVDIFVSVGDLPKIKSYNDTTSFRAGVIYTGGTLKFIPTNNYNGTVSNIKCQVISDSGTEILEDRQDVIYNTRKDFVYGFWNFFAGGEQTASKAQDITRSIAIGNYALRRMVVGNRNIAIGTFALPEVVEGEDNVAIGADTIYPLVKATGCVGIGKATLGGSKSADRCVAIGKGAMGIWQLQQDRSKCTAIGADTAKSIVANCTHVGYRAGANVIGENNTSIGVNSMCVGQRDTVDIVGHELTCIGYKSEIANTDTAKAAVNSTAIGANTTITKSNQVVLGNSAVEEVLIAGKKIIFYEDGSMRWENIT